MNDTTEIHRLRLRSWPRRWRCFLLRLALGRDTFTYMLRQIKADPRLPDAYMVSIIIRKDAVEKGVEGDWLKRIAQMAYHLPVPEFRERGEWRAWFARLCWRFQKRSPYAREEPDDDGSIERQAPITPDTEAP